MRPTHDLRPGTSADFLEPPDAAAMRAAIVGVAGSLRRGARIGPYAIVDLIATGGMGAVYRARRADDAFEKEVAIKVILGVAFGPLALERFRRERQALAQLEHPSITRLIDGGTTDDGLPYLVMELVEGAPLDVHCRAQALSIDERLGLFLRVCEAVDAAHRSLVVHRDLKPDNILVAADGTLKLLDFGVSRLLAEEGEATTLTGDQGRALTLAYASPEQLRGAPVTTATDVYSLGVILYELLTGARPFAVEGLARYDAERLICEQDPVRPSSRLPSSTTPDPARPRPEARRGTRVLRGDLDTITLTALQRDPERRYRSVGALAEDIRRARSCLPLLARPDTRGDRMQRFVRRHRLPLAMTAAMILCLLVAVVGLSAGMVRARAAEADALRSSAAAREALRFYEDVLIQAHPLRSDGPVTVLDLLADAEARLATRGDEPPEIEAGIRFALARSYAALMRWDRALPQIERAHALFAGLPGCDDDLMADCLSLLGRARCQVGVAGGVAIQREALRRRRARHGDDDPRVAESLGTLGYALWTDRGVRRDLAAAEAHYRAALELFDDLGLAVSRDAARVTMSFGFMMRHAGRPDDAEALFTRALAIYEQLPPSEDLYELTTRRLYRRLLMEQGCLTDALVVAAGEEAMLPSEMHDWRAGLQEDLMAIHRAMDHPQARRAAFRAWCRERWALLDPSHGDDERLDRILRRDTGGTLEPTSLAFLIACVLGPEAPDRTMWLLEDAADVASVEGEGPAAALGAVARRLGALAR